MTKHHPVENLVHAISCNSGAMTKEGHEHLLEAAKEVVAAWEYSWDRLKDFADSNGVSVSINYWEASGELELRVSSAAEVENFYMKRAVSVPYFIEQWHKKIYEWQKEQK